jgi:undecaprenyl-diphosphatase
MNLQFLDTQLLLFINHHTVNQLFDVLMPALTYHGYLLIIPFLLAMVLAGTKAKKPNGKTYLATALWAIVIAVCSYFLVVWVEDIVKVAVSRARPCRTIEGIRLIIACPKSFSLPSGHAITSFGVALPLFCLSRGYLTLGWRLYPLLLASAIAFSRLYLGVHYPADVLSGALLGAGIGLGLSLLYRMIINEEKSEKQQ